MVSTGVNALVDSAGFYRCVWRYQQSSREAFNVCHDLSGAALFPDELSRENGYFLDAEALSYTLALVLSIRVGVNSNLYRPQCVTLLRGKSGPPHLHFDFEQRFRQITLEAFASTKRMTQDKHHGMVFLLSFMNIPKVFGTACIRMGCFKVFLFSKLCYV